MVEHPRITVDVHTERSDRTNDDPAWMRYRWMCSECGDTGLADSSSEARAAGEQHLANQHATP